MYVVPKDTFVLTVVRVGTGGNTDDGKYFYGFKPDIVMARKASYINFVLSPDTSEGIRIAAVVDSADHGQMDRAEVEPDGLSARMYDNMIKPALINVAVLVSDDHNPEDKYIMCDPQVINVPD
ncbi:hypothetical protein EGJ34_13300 [Stenotrophomonas sp. 278]|nr:hypothetical protein EGJ34_13300 [Stenotrophomonas sp. 278]